MNFNGIPAGITTAEQAELDAWLKNGPHRTYEAANGRHILRERGELIANRLSLALALGTARERRP